MHSFFSKLNKPQSIHDCLERPESKVKKSILSLVLLAALAQPALSAETITVLHDKVPAPTLIDLGPAGDSAGDQRIWHFLGNAEGGGSVNIDFIMTTTARSDDPAQLDRRMTDAVFSFGEGPGDSLLVHGIGLYPKNGSTVKVSETLERAIIGGTGKYAGARGTVFSTHLADGTWQHVFKVE
jgi:hypothetical protein